MFKLKAAEWTKGLHCLCWVLEASQGILSQAQCSRGTPGLDESCGSEASLGASMLPDLSEQKSPLRGRDS